MLCFALCIDPPLAVEDFRCISENWSSLNCTWREQYNPIRNVSPVKKKIINLLPFLLLDVFLENIYYLDVQQSFFTAIWLGFVCP
jgi:hypothetical protein